jgi:hypothetical protein
MWAPIEDRHDLAAQLFGDTGDPNVTIDTAEPLVIDTL